MKEKQTLRNLTFQFMHMKKPYLQILHLVLVSQVGLTVNRFLCLVVSNSYLFWFFFFIEQQTEKKTFVQEMIELTTTATFNHLDEYFIIVGDSDGVLTGKYLLTRFVLLFLYDLVFRSRVES
jgi:hypothetical protein